MKLEIKDVAFKITRSENGHWIITDNITNGEGRHGKFWSYPNIGEALGHLSLLMCDVNAQLKEQEKEGHLESGAA